MVHLRRCLAGSAAAAAALGLCAGLPLHAHAERFFGADVAYAYDDNLTRAADPSDRRGDSLVFASLRAGQFVALARGDSVEASAGIRATGYARYSLLNGVALDADATYRRKFGLGANAPWISVGVAASHEDLRDDIRDSDRIELSVTAGRRWSERIDVSAGYAHDRRLAEHDEPLVPGISGAPYDGSGDSAFVRAGVALSDRLLLDAAWRIRRGDVVATTPAGEAIFVASTAIAEDGAFGPERYGYRLRGTTRTASVTLSYALGEHSALNFGYAAEKTTAAAGLTYPSQVVSATYVWRY